MYEVASIYTGTEALISQYAYTFWSICILPVVILLVYEIKIKTGLQEARIYDPAHAILFH